MPVAPFLRSPPFPWVETGKASVSLRIGLRDAAEHLPDLAYIKRLVAEARVGGSFWERPIERRARTILRLGRRGFAERIDAARRYSGAEAPLAVLPQRFSEASVMGALRDAAIVHTYEPIDPWSALGPDVALFADSEDEWSLIGALAGAVLPEVEPAEVERQLTSSLLEGIVYRDCFHDRPATIEDGIAILSHWRSILDANRIIVAATGVAWWKERAIRQFLWSGSAYPEIAATADAALAPAGAANGAVAVWPSRTPEGLIEQARARNIPIVAIEDGFIRSVGLGSELHPPWSIVFDKSGIYYDPNGPSDLETILATAQFTPEMLDRAERVRATIVARGISKYSGAASIRDFARTSPRRIVLVAGQVEDDMSVKAAGAGVAGNLDLLRRARQAEPDAYILFKPHPDVDAGHRVGRVPDGALLDYADEIVRDEAMPSLLKRVDAVHVLSSLTGFEALLRGVAVTTHGQPFYAGWGLTRDLAGGLERRTRKLVLAELVAATLIAYPRYLDPKTELPCPPEILLERFAEQQRPKRSWLIRLRRFQGRIARLFGTTTA